MTAIELVPKHEGHELPPALVDLPQGDLLLGYQQRALGECSHYALMVIDKSRRIGLTWGIASYAVLKAAGQKSAGGSDFLYISYSQEMTREFIDACAMWSKAFLPAASDVGEFLFEDQDEAGHTKEIKAFRIRFASGFEIVALSSAPRSIRGKQGVVCIDEAAFVDNLAELLKAALALLMWGGQVIVVSTHNGIDNPFNMLIDDIKSGRKKGGTLTITLADALADGLYERIRLVTGKTPSPDGKTLWEAEVRGSYGEDAEEELDCIPKAGAGCYLDPADISACEHLDAGKPELYQKGLVVIGRDVARRRDLAVIWPFEIVGNHLWLRERYEKAKATFAAQDAVFDRMFNDYHVLRAFIDQTGMGEKVVEDQQIKKGTDRVVGVLLTPATRLDAAIALKKRHEERTIHYPPDPAIRADLRAIKKTKGTGDNIRLVNDETVHSDIFWAAALACLAADMGVLAYRGYRGVPRDGSPFGTPDDYNDGRMRMRPDERTVSRPFGSGTF